MVKGTLLGVSEYRQTEGLRHPAFGPAEPAPRYRLLLSLAPRQTFGWYSFYRDLV